MNNNLDLRCVDVAKGRRAFTLLEVMIALAITLILMGLVMEMFTRVSAGINNSRSNMELNDQLRQAKHRLILDLRGTTAPTVPPVDPNMHLGYFEYVEGPRVANSQYAVGSTGGDVGEQLSRTSTELVNTSTGWYQTRSTIANNFAVNSIIGDTDDILMFTTCSYDDKFVGKAGVRNGIPLAAKSRYAEVAWFLRRRAQNEVSSVLGDNRPEFYTLHRRQFLVLPNGGNWASKNYASVDYSMRPLGGTYENTVMPMNVPYGKASLMPDAARNTLGDLSKRENRSLHQPYLWPYQMLYVAPQFVNNVNQHATYNPASLPAAMRGYAINAPISMLSLPTLAEQTQSDFPLPTPETVSGTPNTTVATYISKGMAAPGYVGGKVHGTAGSRIGADIILTNVVGFDVKAWDPGAPVFRAASTSTNPNNAGVLVPGDGGYASAVLAFNNAATDAAKQPVAFGAFADLFYMGVEPSTTSNITTARSQALARYVAYQETASATVKSSLQKMEAASPFLGRCYVPRAQFASAGNGPLSALTTHGYSRPAVWDSWSTHYEADGVDNDFDGLIDEFTNGVDDNQNGLVDEPDSTVRPDGFMIGEQEAPPPYRSPLRGIKVTIRVMEQDSKEVREVTIVHEFVPL